MSEAYKLKTIEFLGRRVPIVVQNENGPCPMLALANVMLLRNQIHLSPEAPEVTQERLLHLIAGHLLDFNAKERIGEEQVANMTRIIADAVELLPKLTTGIDVNVMFDDIRGFEYTDAIAIFDLLDIHLIHGWLVDPQDRETAAAIGRKSYNALMERMVALTGRPSLTPAASQDNQPVLALTKAPATPGVVKDICAGEGAAAGACESPTGLPAQHPPPPPESEGVGDEASPALSRAAAGAAEAVSGPDAANPVNAPAADTITAAPAPELPEAAGKSATADETIQKGVHAGKSCQRPADAGEGLTEADELDLALKLSLYDPRESSANLLDACGLEDSTQPHTAAQRAAKSLTETCEALPEHAAAEHAKMTAGAPSQSLPALAEDRHHAEMLDHDFVVVEPEEAPGTGFEQVDMPDMGTENAAGTQELTSAHALPAAGNPQQAWDPHEANPELPAEAQIQHGQGCATKACSSSEAAAPADEHPAGSAGDPIAARTGVSSAEGQPQQGPALDERAMALLAALPKPAPTEGCSAPPPEPAVASLQQQHPASGEDAGKDVSEKHQAAVEGASGQVPCPAGMGTRPQGNIARMGSSKEAYLIQSFLDNASSQLTEHGLVSLHQGLKPRQLAILFRNNHFNTLFKYEDALYLLVTDQGYLHEQDVVWEKFDAIDGNTKYVGSQIHPPDPAADSSAADLQLAMQLQQQEDEEHQQRMAAQRQQSGQQSGQRAAPQAAPSNAPNPSGQGSRHGPGPSHGHYRRGRGAYKSQRHGQPAHAAGRGSSSRDCTMM